MILKQILFKSLCGLEMGIVDSDDVYFDMEVISGGDNTNPSWEQYLSEIVSFEHRTHFLLIKEAIIVNDWVDVCADVAANRLNFCFDDDINIGFTWRAWGDLMQSIVGKQEGYMKYYMTIKFNGK